MIQDFSGDQRHVLPDGAAASHIQDLHSPADGEYRLPGSEDPLHKTDLKEIYRNIRLSVSFPRFFPEQERSDIIAAAEEESVAESCILVQQMIAAYKGQDDGNSLCVPDGLDIRIGDKVSVLRKASGDYTDSGFHMKLLFWTVYM